MSRTYSAPRSGHQKQSKVNYQSYFSHPREPQERLNAYMPAELEAELLADGAAMKRKFRRLAHSMRNNYT